MRAHTLRFFDTSFGAEKEVEVPWRITRLPGQLYMGFSSNGEHRVVFRSLQRLGVPSPSACVGVGTLVYAPSSLSSSSSPASSTSALTSASAYADSPPASASPPSQSHKPSAPSPYTHLLSSKPVASCIHRQLLDGGPLMYVGVLSETPPTAGVGAGGGVGADLGGGTGELTSLSSSSSSRSHTPSASSAQSSSLSPLPLLSPYMDVPWREWGGVQKGVDDGADQEY